MNPKIRKAVNWLRKNLSLKSASSQKATPVNSDEEDKQMQNEAGKLPLGEQDFVSRAELARLIEATY